jgi:predicted phage tail protein
VLEERDSENKQTVEHHRQRLRRLKEALSAHKSRFHSQDAKFKTENHDLTEEYKRITEQFKDLQKKFRHFEMVDTKKHREVRSQAGMVWMNRDVNGDTMIGGWVHIFCIRQTLPNSASSHPKLSSLSLQVWDMNEESVMQVVKKVMKADQLIHTQILGLEWVAPVPTDGKTPDIDGMTSAQIFNSPTAGDLNEAKEFQRTAALAAAGGSPETPR